MNELKAGSGKAGSTQSRSAIIPVTISWGHLPVPLVLGLWSGKGEDQVPFS
jgi:hypothetical protein